MRHCLELAAHAVTLLKYHTAQIIRAVDHHIRVTTHFLANQWLELSSPSELRLVGRLSQWGDTSCEVGAVVSRSIYGNV